MDRLQASGCWTTQKACWGRLQCIAQVVSTWLLIFSLYPSPGISFPHVSCSKVVPRCLHGWKPRGNCCGSWQQESKIGKQTFWRKVEEAHRKLRRCHTRLVCVWLTEIAASVWLYSFVFATAMISCARPNSKRRENTSRLGPWCRIVSGHPVAPFHVEAAMRHLAKRKKRKFAQR